MRWTLLAALLLGGPSEEPEIWVFFSPDSPDGAALFRDLGGLRARPVLLTERYFGAREPSAGFLSTAAAAGEVRVVDPEGLREAERLGLRELPAVAVRRGGRTHVACGTRAPVGELLRCGR
jgi:hypothetical protein